MKDINVILGERVRIRRNMIKLTREKLAEMVNVSPRFLAEVEAGKVGVSMETLKSLSIALQVSSDFLLGIKDDAYAISEFLQNAFSNLDPKYYMAILSLINELAKV